MFYLWWTFLVVFLPLILYVGCVIALKWWHGKLIIFGYCKNVPNVKVKLLYTYLQMLRLAYNTKYPRTILLQYLSAFCKLFERERIAYFCIGHHPFVLFYKPEMIEALVNNPITITKSVEYDFLKSWLGTGLLTSTGNKWHSHRKLLTPAFHFQILQNFIPVFNEESTILTRKLESAVGKPWIDIEHPVTMCTLDTICQTAMGVRLNTQAGCCKDYVEGINNVSDVFMYRIVRPWLWLDPVFLYLSPAGWTFRRNVKLIQEFTKKVIKDKKAYLIKQMDNQTNEENPKHKKKAFLELLLEHHLRDATLTEEDIREEVDTFMFEGHDTTAMCICWTLYELGRHREIQERVYQELESIIGKNSDRDITWDDLRQMKYLECTIKESLRIYPSVPFIGRQLTEELKIDNCVLKPGCTCMILIHMLHMDPEQYPMPEIFNPDRFLSDAGKRHPYAYIPFSAGPRNCIGQKFALLEIKTVLAKILQKFKVTSLDPRDKLEIMAGIILKNAEHTRVRFEYRTLDNTQ